MENQQQPPSFSAYEYVKMASLTTDAMKKIQKVLERLQKNGDVKNATLLLQALESLNHVNTKLVDYGRAKAKLQAKKTLERAKDVLERSSILGEKPGG